MRRFAFLLAVALACACCEIAVAEPPASQPAKRTETATVVDSSGRVTEVTNLTYYDSNLYSDSDRVRQPIVLQTKTFKLHLELSRVISIEAKGKGVEIKYIWGSKEKSATGLLEPTGIARAYVLGGKSALSRFSLPSDELKQLKVHEAPIPDKDEEEYETKTPLDTTLVFLDGTKARVGGLERTYFGPNPKPAAFFIAGQRADGPEMVWRHAANIPVMRGGSNTTVEFKSLRSIEFGENGEYTVTTKDGEKATGTLGADLDSEQVIESFKGRCDEYGGFWIAPKLIKSVLFDPKRGADPGQP